MANRIDWTARQPRRLRGLVVRNVSSTLQALRDPGSTPGAALYHTSPLILTVLTALNGALTWT